MKTDKLLLQIMQFTIYYYYYYYIVIACSADSSRLYTDTHKEIRLYIKETIQNKVHTVQIQTYTISRNTHVIRRYTQQSQCIWVSSVIATLLVSSVFIKSRKDTGFVYPQTSLQLREPKSCNPYLTFIITSSLSQCPLSEGQTGGAWERTEIVMLFRPQKSILWHVDPLLGNDSEISTYTPTVISDP
jgi:hypothetical protein